MILVTCWQQNQKLSISFLQIENCLAQNRSFGHKPLFVINQNLSLKLKATGCQIIRLLLYSSSHKNQIKCTTLSSSLCPILTITVSYIHLWASCSSWSSRGMWACVFLGSACMGERQSHRRCSWRSLLRGCLGCRGGLLEWSDLIVVWFIEIFEEILSSS